MDIYSDDKKRSYARMYNDIKKYNMRSYVWKYLISAIISLIEIFLPIMDNYKLFVLFIFRTKSFSNFAHIIFFQFF